MSHLKSYYAGKKVLLTGHTGFKGAWLSEWLLEMGAAVTGVSLSPNTEPSLFCQLDLASRLEHHILDIKQQQEVSDLIAALQPDIVFHLAAQPLVRYSYDYPIETFATNVMGTAHVLEGLRRVEGVCQAVMITTDKCYENREQVAPYSEDDPMGGHDPYSASKGAAELVIASYRRSFFAPEAYGRTHSINLASARAGNVIGGGDWALDRIVPDCMRMLGEGVPIAVRNARATRPWQHVLEPLGGYLTLAHRMAKVEESAARELICSGFNFGPDPEANRPVRDLVEKVISCWPGEWIDGTDPNAPHEAGLLNLTIDKAESLLAWRPVWDFDQAIEQTVDWYRTAHEDSSLAKTKTLEQIQGYVNQM
ncbi:CDP-glucose 4,6-dehydratase [Coraliomargarita sp. W4R72]